MVQYKPAGFRPAAHGPTHYWKLDTHWHQLPSFRPSQVKKGAHEIMAMIGYTKRASEKMTTQRKHYLLVRHDCDLLEYEKCTVRELRRFCKSRNISVASGAHKADLVAELEQADEEATFDRFQDLPPELRVLVYNFYFAGLKTDQIGIARDYHMRYMYDRQNTLPTQPPLTQVSRLLRNESLPLFYSECTFNFIKHNRGEANVRFQHSASAEILASICKFRLTLAVRADLSLWTIDISKNVEVAVQKLADQGRTFSSEEVAEEVADAVEKRAQEIREHLESRGLGKGKTLGLERSDIRSIMGMWPDRLR